MKLELFDGGLATRRSPHLIGINEGEEYENIDNTKGILEPVKTKLAANAVSKYSHYYIAQSQWVSSSTYRDYLEYRETLYYTESGTYPKKYDGTTTNRLGIVAPTNAPSLDFLTRSPPPPKGVTLTQVVSATAPDGWNVSATVDDHPTNYVHSMTRHKDTDTPVKYMLVNEHLETGLISPPFYETIVLTGVSTQTACQINGLVRGIGNTRVYREREGDYRLVGTLTSTVTSIEDNVADIYSNTLYDDDQAAKVDGTYQYIYTFYNSTDGAESGPSKLSIEGTIDRGKVNLGNLQVSSDPQVDKKRIYRVGGALTEFTLVAEIANSASTYLDLLSDTEVDGRLFDANYNDEPESGLRYLVESYGVLFAAKEDRLYYSKQGEPDAWPSTNYIDFEAEITGIGVMANGIMVFTRYKSWVVTGTSTTTFVRYPLGGDQGCVSHQSIQKMKGAVIWMSTDGVCTTSGNEVLVLSKDKLGKQNLTIENAVVHDEVYYAHQTNGKTLALDVRFGSAYKQFDLGIDRVVVAEDILYGWYAGSLYKLFTESTTESLTYHSPVLTEGSYSNRKTYKEFYVRSEGNLTITILIDDVVVSTQTLTTKDTHDLKIPQNTHSGYSMQFQITGTGTVYEIEYKALSRQNAR